jgi:hypothetical protein
MEVLDLGLLGSSGTSGSSELAEHPRSAEIK